MMIRLCIVAFCLGTATAVAKPSLFLGDEIYATPGVECNIYFRNVTDAICPDNFAWHVICEKGRHEESRWMYKPVAADAGRRFPLVVQMWNDDSRLVTAVTTTVCVAAAPVEKTRPFALALLADSLTNCFYQDHLFELMQSAGFSGYRAVGLHSGYSAAIGHEKGHPAAHDGYGGYTWGSFLMRYEMSVDEIDNVQAEEERAQLQKFGAKIPPGQEWRKALLKSPLVILRNGKKVVDVQQWFDRINGGVAPDVIVIELGTNDTFAFEEDNREVKISSNILPHVTKVLDTLRTAAPQTVIAVVTCLPGTGQDAFANYGCKSAFVFRRNAFAYNVAIDRLIKARNDPRLVLVPLHVAVDPMHGYIQKSVPAHARTTTKVVRAGNAVHPDLSGGRQIGDCLYAWLMNRWRK